MIFVALLVTLAGVLDSVDALPQLLFANRRDVSLVDAGCKCRNSTVVVSGLEDAAALDFVYSDNAIYWTDITLEAIKRTWINGSHNVQDIITTDLVSPDGLACDWLGRKIYWTDAETNRIEVSQLDGSQRKVLFWSGLDQPRAIALDPANGYIYWTDWGEEPKIERASMAGGKELRQVLVNRDIYWPNGLALDYTDHRIYWTDARKQWISSCYVDGSDRKIITQQELPHPFSITVYLDMLYWTDWTTHSIHSCNKHTGRDQEVVLDHIFSPLDIHTFLPSRQLAGTNPCGPTNGGCSHLCLMSPVPPHYACACPTGVQLLADNKTCAHGPQEVLLLARRTDIRRISLDTPDYTDVVLPISHIQHVIAVDYDPVEGHIYWTDDESKTISRANMDGSGREVVVGSDVVQADGLAVDWLARNLYWTDTGTDRIEVARLNGTSRKVLVSEKLEEPRTIVVDPEAGYMYWTDWGQEPKIERAALDGSERRIIISTSLGWPNGLALDLKERCLYWADARTDRIEMANMDGSNRRTLVSGSESLPHVFGFSLLGEHVYWTDWQRRSIERINKRTGGNRMVIVDQLPDLMGLKAINVSRMEGSNACSVGNGGCSHLCLMRPRPYGRVCACPMGLELLPDSTTCYVPEAFLLFSYQSDIRRISLESNHNDMVIPLTGVKYAFALDFDINDNRIYWSDTTLKSISRAFMNGSALEHIVEYGLEYPESMAVDWVAHNLYWTDTGTQRIEMARMDGSSRRVIIWQEVEPRAIALDPPNGYIYFSNWESNGGRHERIERAALDGSGRVVLVKNAGQVTGLALDFGEQRLYWTNVHDKVIVSYSLTGSDHHHVLQNLQNPSSLTLYQDFIYWSDWDTMSIERANKSTGGNRTRIHDQLKFIMDILVFHQSRQSGWNTCGVNNGGCSHLCVAHPTPGRAQLTHHCACPTHYSLSPDNRTCLPPQMFLLYSQKTNISRLLVDSHSAPDMVLPIQNLRKITAIDYDPIDNYVYWVDRRNKVKAIRRARDNGTNVVTVVESPGPRHDFSPYDIAVDPYSRHLYWTDADTNIINVTRLDGRAVGVVMNDPAQFPRNIVLAPKHGYMFWTNMAKTVTIERADMDGQSRMTLITTALGKPGALAVNSQSQHLFWTDTELKRIEMAKFDGMNREVLHDDGIGEPVGLAVLDGMLYWVDRAREVLERIDIKTRAKVTIQGRLSQLRDIHAVQGLTFAEQNMHACGGGGQHCSHLCVAREHSPARCACPVGVVLANDRKNCQDPPTCDTNQFTCRKTGMCIPIEWQCDGSTECDDDSDEKDCPDCAGFQCKDSPNRCLMERQRCDGVPQCSDGSDEANCAPCTAADQFECASERACVSSALLCNSVRDCRGGEDEAHCPLPSDSALVRSPPAATTHQTISIVVSLLVIVVVVVIAAVFCRRKAQQHLPLQEPDILMVTKPLNADLLLTIPMPSGRGKKGGGGPGTCTLISDGEPDPLLYDRCHVTGASSSASSAGTRYPKETLNPPPSPVTDRSLYVGEGSPTTTSRSYRNHYRYHHHHRSRHRHVPPLPTPCSTDVCDSDIGSRALLDYDSEGPFLNPPPTPRSNYLSDGYSCPPSPSTEHSFNPYPPPPSPAATSDC